MRRLLWGGLAAMALTAAAAAQDRPAAFSVGGQGYPTLQAAHDAAPDGGRITVAAGQLGAACAAHVRKRLTVVGAGDGRDGGPATVCRGGAIEGKAVIVTDAELAVERMRFEAVKVPDGNGAPIRQQNSASVRMSHVTVAGSENGFLGGGGGRIAFDNVVFIDNGGGDGSTHAIYVGPSDAFVLDTAKFTGTKIGHDVKTRARSNVIRKIEAGGGRESFAVDMPHAGPAVIEDSVLRKGPDNDNTTIVAWGAEGGWNPGDLIIRRTRFVSTTPKAIAIRNYTTTGAVVECRGCDFDGPFDNIAFGPIRLIDWRKNGVQQANRCFLTDPGPCNAPTPERATAPAETLAPPAPPRAQAAPPPPAAAPAPAPAPAAQTPPPPPPARAAQAAAAPPAPAAAAQPRLPVQPDPPPAGNWPLADIARGLSGWAKIPMKNAFRDAWPPAAGHPGWAGSPSKVVIAWGGAAYGRRALYVIGGGHSDYGGNEVYRLNLEKLMFERLTDPSPYVPGSYAPGPARTTDGTPPSAHTYDGLVYVPSLHAVAQLGGAPFSESGGGTDRADLFLINERKWRPMEKGAGGWVASDIDPATGLILASAHQSLVVTDPRTGKVVSRTRGQNWSQWDVAGAWLPREKLFVVPFEDSKDGSRCLVWDLSKRDLRQPGDLPGSEICRYWNADGTARTSLPAWNRYGYAYHAPTGSIAAWNGGADVYLIRPHGRGKDGPWDFRVTKVSPRAGQPAPDELKLTSGGVYGRWVWIEEIDAFLGWQNWQGDPWLFKLPGRG
ncbi:MAG: hypothetical protein AB7K86_21005 [Rhodospirillales bacterium]